MKANPQYRIAKRKRRKAYFGKSPEEYQEYIAAWRRQRIKENQEFLREYKESKPCKDCGNFYPARAMDFHHRNIEEKKYAVSGMLHHSRAKIEEEIAKCDLLCAVHHRLRH